MTVNSTSSTATSVIPVKNGTPNKYSPSLNLFKLSPNGASHPTVNVKFHPPAIGYLGLSSRTLPCSAAAGMRRLTVEEEVMVGGGEGRKLEVETFPMMS